MNVLSRKKNAVQRQIRHGGLGSYEREAQSTLLALCETSVNNIRFFDIGAHMGTHSSLVANIFHSVHPSILAIEPTPDTARDADLLRRANGNRYTIVNAAVSDTHGDVPLHRLQTDEPESSIMASFDEQGRTVQVPLTTLDRILDDGFVAPTILRVDAGLLAANVIRGGLTTIWKHRPFMTVGISSERDQQLLGAMLRAIEAFGYRFYRVSPDHSWEPNDAIQIMTSSSTPGRHLVCSPTELSAEFFDARIVWQDALTLCGKATNVLVDARAPLSNYVSGTVGLDNQN